MKKDLIAIVRRHVTSRLARAPDRDAFACTILGRSLRTAPRQLRISTIGTKQQLRLRTSHSRQYTVTTRGFPSALQSRKLIDC